MMSRLEGRAAGGPVGEQQRAANSRQPSSRMRQRYNDIRDEEREKNKDLLSFAHRTVQRDTARQVGLSSGEISKTYGRSPRRIPPRKVIIQNSSALVKREQELLKRPVLARDGSVTTVTRSLTATTVSLGDLTLIEVPGNDSAGGAEEEHAKPFIEDASVQVLSDDEEHEQEEESSDDEREWRKDNDALNIPHVGSEEDHVYESCSSSSGYITEDHNIDIDSSDDSLEASSWSSLNSSAWRIPITEGENETETEAETQYVPHIAQWSESESKIEPKEEASGMPVAVVFEIDDMTDDSQGMSEEGLLRFVKDFTEEMKEGPTEEMNAKTPTSPPSVRLYSTVGAKRSDLKSALKRKVLSSETIVSTILENRARQHDKDGEAVQTDDSVHPDESAKATTASIFRTHRKRFCEDIVAAMCDGNEVEESATIHMVSKARADTESTEERELTTKPKHMDALKETEIKRSEKKRVRAAKNATDFRQLQQRKKASEANATVILAAAKAKHQAERRGHPESTSTNELTAGTTVSCTTSTLREEIERRRQRIKCIRESNFVITKDNMSRDDARAVLEQRKERIKSRMEKDDTCSNTDEQKICAVIPPRENCSGREDRFSVELKAEIEQRRQHIDSDGNLPKSDNTTALDLSDTSSRNGNIKQRKIKHEDSSAGTLTVVTSNRSSEQERKTLQGPNNQEASSILRNPKKNTFSGFIGRLLGSKHGGGKKLHGQVSRRNGATSSPSKSREDLQHCASSVVSTPSRRPKKNARSAISKKGDRSGSYPVQHATRNNTPSHRSPFFRGHYQRHRNEDPDSPSVSLQDCKGENGKVTSTQMRCDEKALLETETSPLRIHCSHVHLKSTLEDVDVISFDELCTSTALASASWV